MNIRDGYYSNDSGKEMVVNDIIRYMWVGIDG
jgi:hypothetical protein